MKTAWIALGRNGDILNILPLVWNDYQNGNRPTVVVAEQFASLLDGISYADRYVWNGAYTKPADAFRAVEETRQFEAIYLPQCYGTAFDRECNNFCEEAWRLVGLHELWDTLPLVFDRRDDKRETALFYNILRKIPTVPLLLVSHGGNSSPFAKRQELMELLEPLREDFQIVDISNIRAERFYDLLGLYERAAGLISTDSGCLHLAQAAPGLPVIALVADGWHGSPWRKTYLARIEYSQFQYCKREIIKCLNTLA